MSRTWHILKREYLENVRTKAFIIGLVLTPVWMGVIFLVPRMIEGKKYETAVIVDATGVLAGPVSEKLSAIPDPEWTILTEPAERAWEQDANGLSRVERLKREAGEGKHYLILLTPPVLEKRPAEVSQGERSHGVFGPTSGVTGPGRVLEALVNGIVTQRIIEERELPKEMASLLQRPATRFEAVTEKGEKAGAVQVLLPIIVVMLLYMGIVGISQMLISNTIEEKANRVYEVLLSSVSPYQLMSGKILGICGVGLTLLTFWSGGGLLAATLQGSDGLVGGQQIGMFVVYYLLGFLMIASLFVAVGSACNTIKEAQNLMAPLSMLLAVPLILSMVTLQNPNGQLATVSSFIPPFTPFVMMTRIASVPSPPAWQIAATIGLLAISTWLAVRLAARVFRVGILLYGQPPSVKELWRWVRAKD
ncbi:MAG: ABC transporter permease [Planctomycetota bacterium]|nr:ABC transporter permease [Planctomycetota bacterium]